MPTCAVALACLVLREYVPVPIWVSFIPPVLAWAAIGFAGMRMQFLLGARALSVGLSPLLATALAVIPAGRSEASTVGLTAFRQSIAATIAIMAPLALGSASIGGAFRALFDRVKPPTWAR